MSSTRTIEDLVHYQAHSEILWVMMGAGLVSMYLRARFFDSNNLESYVMEGMFYRFAVSRTKNSRMDSTRLELIMLAPRESISGHNIIESYLDEERNGYRSWQVPLVPSS